MSTCYQGGMFCLKSESKNSTTFLITLTGDIASLRPSSGVPGYVTLGFGSCSMSPADTMSCINFGGTVYAVSGKNPSTSHSATIPDATNYLTLISSSVSGTKLTCSFERPTSPMGAISVTGSANFIWAVADNGNVQSATTILSHTTASRGPISGACLNYNFLSGVPGASFPNIGRREGFCTIQSF
jgi:hypothetical protein